MPRQPAPPHQQSNHSPSNEPLLIQGNFHLLKKSRRLKVLAVLSGLMVSVGVVIALTVYAINVQMANQMNALSKRTREVNEINKDLAVRLNRIRAFKNIESSAAKLSHLRPPQEVIEITINPDQIKRMNALTQHPTRQGKHARVFGY